MNLSRSSSAKAYLLTVFAICIIALYLWGAFRNAQLVNTDYNRTDQGSFMQITRLAHSSRLKFTGNRNQMPLYSYVQLLSYHPDLSDQEFFQRGKRLNILLSLFYLMVLFLIFRKAFPTHHAWNLIGVTAFSVFIFKAGYFHCSLTYYFLHFMSFVLMCRLLTKPSIGWGFLTGAVMGLAYLTKASFLPFVAAAGFGFLIKLFVERKSGFLRNTLFSATLLAISFLVITGPYLLESKQKHGRFFYNVNSSFYMWYKTRPEIFAETSTRKHGDRTGWPDLPPENIPGPLKYLKENSTADILGRIAAGTIRMLRHVKSSYGFFKYMLFYAAFAFLILCIRKTTMARLRNHVPLALFLTAYFSVYFLSYGFYMATGPIIRHVLSLFLPFLFTVSLITVPTAQAIKIPRTGVSVHHAMNLLITLILLPDIYFVLTDRVLRIFGAD